MRDADADPRAATRPLELVGTLQSINKAEKLIKDVIAEVVLCLIVGLFLFIYQLASHRSYYFVPYDFALKLIISF